MITIKDLSPLGIDKNSIVLAIFPHPDDESAYAGGLLQRIVSIGAKLALITLTDGERSTLRYGLGPSEDLATVRRLELASACQILGVKNYQYGHFPDGALADKKIPITAYVDSEISSLKPTHLIVMEPFGIYGHPDHIASSEIVSALVKLKYPNIQMLYITVDANFYVPSESARNIAVNLGKFGKPQIPEYKFELTRDERNNKILCFQKYRSQFIVDEAFIHKWQKRTLLNFEYITTPH